MGIRAVLRRWFGPKARRDFYGLATRTRAVPPAELAVAEAALTGGGPIADRLLAQLRDAPDVYRVVSDDGTYELRVSALTLVHGVPRTGWMSDPIPVRAVTSSRDLEIRVGTSMAGIAELHGRALDGRRWPSDWAVADDTIEAIRARAPWLRLPTPAEQRATRSRAVETIEAWLGEPGLLNGRHFPIDAEAPATHEAIAAFEEAHGFVLPEAYRALLLGANGIEVGSLVVMGTDDAYRLDITGPDRLVIAPPDEDGAVVLAPDGEVRFVDLGDRTSEGRTVAPDLRTWVRRRVQKRRTTG